NAHRGTGGKDARQERGQAQTQAPIAAVDDEEDDDEADSNELQSALSKPPVGLFEEGPLIEIVNITEASESSSQSHAVTYPRDRRYQPDAVADGDAKWSSHVRQRGLEKLAEREGTRRWGDEIGEKIVKRARDESFGPERGLHAKWQRWIPCKLRARALLLSCRPQELVQRMEAVEHAVLPGTREAA